MAHIVHRFPFLWYKRFWHHDFNLPVSSYFTLPISWAPLPVLYFLCSTSCLLLPEPPAPGSMVDGTCETTSVPSSTAGNNTVLYPNSTPLHPVNSDWKCPRTGQGRVWWFVAPTGRDWDCPQDRGADQRECVSGMRVLIGHGAGCAGI